MNNHRGNQPEQTNPDGQSQRQNGTGPRAPQQPQRREQ